MTQFGNLAARLTASRKVRCPLCHVEMGFKHVKHGERKLFVFYCDIDLVAIAADDPLVGKWEAAYEKIGTKMLCPVPSCGTVMRFFCTSTGYTKFKCPRSQCAATLANPVAPDDEVAPSPDMPKEDITRKPAAEGHA